MEIEARRVLGSASIAAEEKLPAVGNLKRGEVNETLLTPDTILSSGFEISITYVMPAEELMFCTRPATIPRVQLSRWVGVRGCTLINHQQ